MEAQLEECRLLLIESRQLRKEIETACVERDLLLAESGRRARQPPWLTPTCNICGYSYPPDDWTGPCCLLCACDIKTRLSALYKNGLLNDELLSVKVNRNDKISSGAWCLSDRRITVLEATSAILANEAQDYQLDQEEIAASLLYCAYENHLLSFSKQGLS